MAQNTSDSIRIGFAKLGGVFASAMTGNSALLAYHIARGNTLSAIFTTTLTRLIGGITDAIATRGIDRAPAWWHPRREQSVTAEGVCGLEERAGEPESTVPPVPRGHKLRIVIWT